jgi:hypothetical protein
MKFKICLLFVLWFAVACSAKSVPMDTDASVADTPVGSTDEEIMANYLTDVNDYWENTQWRSWMIQRKDWWSSAYISGRRSHEVHVYVRYENPVLYNPPWTSEAEHFKALKQMADLQYPGWDFTFLPYEDGVEASMKGYDIVAVLGHYGTSYATGRTIYLVYETIFAHEFGHTLGLHHHYCNNGGGDQCPEAYPPDEGKCIMDRTSVSFGPTENRFLLLTTGERRDDEISAALSNILDRYPGQGFAPINWNECGMEK